MAEVFHGGKGHVFDREDLERLYKMTKHQLKQYEAAFQKRHGRAASKTDIAANEAVGETACWHRFVCSPCTLNPTHDPLAAPTVPCLILIPVRARCTRHFPTLLLLFCPSLAVR